MLQQGVQYFAYSENNRRERKRKLVEVAPRERNVRFKLYGTEGRRYVATLQELAGLAIERAATTIQKFARSFHPRAIYGSMTGWLRFPFFDRSILMVRIDPDIAREFAATRNFREYYNAYNQYFVDHRYVNTRWRDRVQEYLGKYYIV